MNTLISEDIQTQAKQAVQNFLLERCDSLYPMEYMFVVGFEIDYPYTRMYIKVLGKSIYLFEYSYNALVAEADHLSSFRLQPSGKENNEVPDLWS